MQIDRDKMVSTGNSCRVLLVGLGNAGCRTLGTLVAHGIDIPDSIAVHTDEQALKASRAPRQLVIGDGFSTGGDVMQGKVYGEDSRERLRELFGHYRLIFFIIGMGGGTGNGAGPVFVELAREVGAFSLCMAVLPFGFEGERKKLKAESGVATLREVADGVICFPNQRLFQLIAADTSYVEALRSADEFLSSGILRLWRLLNEPGVLNLDFNDVRSLVRHSHGTCTLASIEKAGKDRIREAVEAILTDVLFERGTVITKAKAILVGIVGGPEISLAEVELIHRELGKVAPPDVIFFSGVTILAEMQGKISLTVLASESWVAVAADEGEEESGLVQEDLGLAIKSDAFEGTAASKYEGEDLDVPTFIRRGVRLSKG